MSSHDHLSLPKYRPDIDGLRAVAVLSVVGFHAFPSWVKGGFIGVDVFFVISGYLISTVIFESLNRGTFSFAEFYGRRINRIFPALLLILAAVYALGWLTLLADEYKQLGKHMVGGSGFISNIVLFGESGYFDTSSDTKPLIHLWSLGIEEQFYIIWPLLLYISFKRRFNPIFIVGICIALSFLLNIRFINTNPVATFYLPLTRFWELLCGSALAWATLHKKSSLLRIGGHPDGWLSVAVSRWTTDGNTLANFLSFAGLSLCVYGVYAIDKEVKFPGLWAMVPVGGATLVIMAGPNAWLNRVVLSNRLLVWFGLISFPLYLWHWPLLSFERIVGGQVPSGSVRITTIAISVVLAWLTYRFIERPIRVGGYNATKALTLIALMVMAGFAGYYTHIRDGLVYRKVVTTSVTLNSGNDVGDGGNSINECGIQDANIKNLFGACLKDRRGVAKFALLGDSKAQVLYAGLVRTSTDRGRWLFIGGNGANGAAVPLISSEPVFAGYQKLATTAVKAIAENNDIETVAIVAAVRTLFSISDNAGVNSYVYDYKYMNKLSQTPNYRRALNGFSQTISILVRAGKRVVLVVDNPVLPSPQDCVSRNTPLHITGLLGNRNSDCFVPLATHNKLTETYRNLLIELQNKYTNKVDIFDPTNILCDATSGICGPDDNGRLLYSFTDHISDYAAGKIGMSLNAYLNASADKAQQRTAKTTAAVLPALPRITSVNPQ